MGETRYLTLPGGRPLSLAETIASVRRVIHSRVHNEVLADLEWEAGLRGGSPCEPLYFDLPILPGKGTL